MAVERTQDHKTDRGSKCDGCSAFPVWEVTVILNPRAAFHSRFRCARASCVESSDSQGHLLTCFNRLPFLPWTSATELQSCGDWLGPDSHLFSMYVDPGRQEFRLRLLTTGFDTEEMMSVKWDLPDKETQDQTDEQAHGPSHRNAGDDQQLELESTSETARSGPMNSLSQTILCHHPGNKAGQTHPGRQTRRNSCAMMHPPLSHTDPLPQKSLPVKHVRTHVAQGGTQMV